MPIKQLPANVANQIAAGEVVERPASVIKELLENALDAGAQSIQIDIEKGGLALCRVRDDGRGIPQAELPLAIAPHATSKISQVSDLMLLDSLGFRGEALASISAVSKFHLISQPVEQSHAAEISFDESGKWQVQPAAHPLGTSISVADLFYNVPVRRKFLKSSKTEFTHIEAVVKKVALSRFDIALTLNHNGRTVWQVSSATSKQAQLKRIGQMLGGKFLEHCHAIEVDDGELSLTGYLVHPEYLRSQNDWQYIFLNGRMVRDKLLMHALRQAYEPFLYPGRSACFILYFTLPKQEVDVNVHPTKHEVRFREPRRVHDFLLAHLSRFITQLVESDNEALVQDSVIEQSVDTTSASNPSTSRQNDNQPRQIEPRHTQSMVSTHFRYKNLAAPETSLIDSQQGSTIIPLSSEVGLYLVDGQSYLFKLSTLYQAWLKHRITESLDKDGKLSSRSVLVPLTVSLNSIQVKIFPYERLHALGFDIAPLSENSLCLRAFPIITPHINLQTFVMQVAKMETSDVCLIKSICQNQLIDFALLNEQEKKTLMHFLIKNYDDVAVSARQLSAQQWQAVLNAPL